MDYKETLKWLFSQLPMYQRIGKAAYKADLETTIQLPLTNGMTIGFQTKKGYLKNTGNVYLEFMRFFSPGQ